MKVEKDTTRKKEIKLVLVMALLIAINLVIHSASAEQYLLTVSQAEVFVGDTLDMAEYLSQDEVDTIQYAISQESPNKDSITLSANGKIKTVKAGQAVIQVTYCLKGESATKTEEFTVNVLEPEKVTASYGDSITLKAMELYPKERYTYTFSNDSLVWKEEALLVQGFTKTQVFVQKGEDSIFVGEITIEAPEFTKKSLARAKDSEAFVPEIDHYSKIQEEEIVWKIENENIATVTQGKIQGKKVGKTTVEAVITAVNKDTVTIEAPLQITDPKIKEKTFALAQGKSKTLVITGTSAASTYEYDTDQGKNAYFTSKTKILGNWTGSTELGYNIDGREFTIKVYVTDPHFAQRAFPMYKGLKKKLSIGGLNKTYSKVTYTSSNKKIAKISKAGKVTAVKTGVAYVTVKADGRSFKVWLEISTKTGYKAAKKEIAISKTKTKYSQIKRMNKGYYDCSSLVSRVYRKYGVYFGSKSGWSPTAAGIGSWCTKHGKVLYKKGVSYTKLVPGDLIFYSYTKNGRYRNISHIEMYVGNGMSVSASSSNNKVIHYDYSKYKVVLIARPTK